MRSCSHRWQSLREPSFGSTTAVHAAASHTMTNLEKAILANGSSSAEHGGRQVTLCGTTPMNGGPNSSPAPFFGKTTRRKQIFNSWEEVMQELSYARMIWRRASILTGGTTRD